MVLIEVLSGSSRHNLEVSNYRRGHISEGRMSRILESIIPDMTFMRESTRSPRKRAKNKIDMFVQLSTLIILNSYYKQCHFLK